MTNCVTSLVSYAVPAEKSTLSRFSLEIIKVYGVVDYPETLRNLKVLAVMIHRQKTTPGRGNALAALMVAVTAKKPRVIVNVKSMCQPCHEKLHRKVLQVPYCS